MLSDLSFAHYDLDYPTLQDRHGLPKQQADRIFKSLLAHSNGLAQIVDETTKHCRNKQSLQYQMLSIY
jgi:hypothetical protein